MHVFKLNKKYFSAFLVTVLSVTICLADQLAWVSKSEAIKAVNLLNNSKNVVLFCGCCENDTKQRKSLKAARYTQVSENRAYYNVSVLYEDKGKSDWHDVDLAYIHVEIDGLWHSVGKALGMQCDPCTLPFDLKNHSSKKTSNYNLESGFTKGKYENKTQNSGHHLEISEVTQSSFKFNLQVGTDKMCTGDITGVAKYQLNNKTALFLGSDGCLIRFTQTTPEQIKVTEDNCTYYHGAQCSFDAELKKVNSQNVTSYDINFKEPVSVVNAIIYSAKSMDFEILQGLCDPYESGDGDTKRICTLFKLLSQKTTNPDINSDIKRFSTQFIEAFKNCSIGGPVIYEKKENNHFAKVNLLIESKIETVTLINRSGNWYLYSI